MSPALAAAALPPGDYVRQLPFGGFSRSYLLRVPASWDGTTPVPLVLDFHGFTSYAEQQKAISGWTTVAEREGILLAHPEGLFNAWNAGLCCGNLGIDDVGFVRAVVAAIAAENPVDLDRVYATGLSNGGAISQRLGCDAPDLFAAVAPMAFPLPAAPLTGCRPSRPISTLTVMGLTDMLVRYDGGPFPSAADTFDYWHDLDGCRGAAPQVVERSGQSRCETYTDCAADTQVCLCSVVARAFPGAAFDGHVLYLNDDLNLANVAWGFLSKFRLPDGRGAIEGELRGSDALTVKGGGTNERSVAWRVRIANGTWSASEGGEPFLAGSARRRGARRWALTLASAAEELLVERLSSRARVSADAMRMRGPVQLTAALDRSGTRLALGGRLRLGGKGSQRVTVRVRLDGLVGQGS